MRTTRRNFFATAFTGAVAAQTAPPRIYLDDYQPRSTVVLPQNPVARARYPVIDVHTHVSHLFGARIFGADTMSAPEATDLNSARLRVQGIVRTMDQLNVRTLVNLTGGTGPVLARNIAELQRKHEGRFFVCTEPSYAKYADPGYPAWQAQELQRARDAGARGLKIIKSLGLVLRERITEGSLVKVDDPRFDPMWDAAGRLNLPVFIHVGDPDAFFLPPDRTNERYEELQRHPDWSFHGKDYPKKEELLAQRNRVMERHPKTTFVCLHVANHPENLDDVSECLSRYPNMHCEIGARVSELGRQPRRSRRFFEDFQDRIQFGTDAVRGISPNLYAPYFRFLETLDDYFDYSANPGQGRWKIYGIGLPDAILKKVYHNNAARVLGLPPIV